MNIPRLRRSGETAKDEHNKDDEKDENEDGSNGNGDNGMVVDLLVEVVPLAAEVRVVEAQVECLF